MDRQWRLTLDGTVSTTIESHVASTRWQARQYRAGRAPLHADSFQMSSRIEILNEGGFRSDGRRQYELRETTFDSTVQAGADGSARIAHGLTEVLVSVFGPREARVRAQTLHDRAAIHVEATIAPFSASDRRRRGRGDKRVLELAATIKATFEPVVQTSLYPRSQIDIFVHVLQQDGGVLQAAINATTVALVNAGVPLADYVCAVTGGVHAAAPMLDLTALEEADLPHVTVASMPRSGHLTLVSMETRLHIDRFEEILRLAGEAGAVIHKEMRAVVRGRTKSLLDGLNTGLRPSHADEAMVEDE